MSSRRATPPHNAEAQDPSLASAGGPQELEQSPISHGAGLEVELAPHFANNLISREFVVSISGSLDDFERNPEKASWRIPEGHQAVYQSRTRYKPNCRKAATRQGDLSNVVLVGMRLKKISSTFPCHLGMSFTGAKGNTYTAAGEQYAYLAGANENTQHLDKVIVKANPYLNSEYLKLYPGMTADKLRNELIMRPPGQSYVYVDKSHPIIEMMNENKETLQINLGEEHLMDDQYYKVSSAVADRCLNELETELIDNLPVMDLSQWSASIHRIGGLPWSSREEVCDNLEGQRDLQRRMMATKRRLTAVVQLDYAFA